MKHLWSRRWFKALIILLAIVILLFLFRNPMLRGIGNWLAADDELVKTEACFVLGGNSYERGTAALGIYERFPDQQFVTTGGNYSYQVMCLDTTLFEAQLTRHLMVNHGIPDAQVVALSSAHSTMEESDEILAYCQQQNILDITVVSSELHLRRVRWVFEDKFEDAAIKVHFYGAKNPDYNRTNWWHHEEGLIMTNNEVVKLFYYFFKY